MRELDANAVAREIRRTDEPTPVLLDVREEWEVETASLEAALHIPMATIPGRVSELDPARPVIVMCHHGARSRLVAQWLESQGFSDVANFEGGIDAWSRQIDPSVPTY